jgi:L-aspartate oxidase
LIIGSGIAGLNLARKLAQAGQKVFLASKEAITEGASKYAQGGVAVVSPLNPEDKLDGHVQDTLRSGKELCNEEVVREILSQGWARVEELRKLGVPFDKDFNLEGSHGYKRIMHVGDATGRAIMKPLLDNVSRNHNVFISQGTEAMSLISDAAKTKVIGASFVDITGESFDIFANNIVLATGGFAALYEDYTCPSILTGDGIALAYDAGAKLENLEFVQFHPTVYKAKNGFNFLISEALRGAGAILRNSKEELFAHKYHPDAELATRDIVSRAIFSEMRLMEAEHVYIDSRHLGKDFLRKDFPTIYNYCLAEGYDLAQDLLPVRPAAHYSVGGIKTDLKGRTNVKSLYAVGECASTGLHGANRLASNSLLECIVMAENLANDILEQESQTMSTEQVHYCSDYLNPIPQNSEAEISKWYKDELQEIRTYMSRYVSVERREKTLYATMKFLENLSNTKERTVALLLTKSALMRKESRGGHYRVDSPKTQLGFARSTILSKENIYKKRDQESQTLEDKPSVIV